MIDKKRKLENGMIGKTTIKKVLEIETKEWDDKNKIWVVIL